MASVKEAFQKFGTMSEHDLSEVTGLNSGDIRATVENLKLQGKVKTVSPIGETEVWEYDESGNSPIPSPVGTAAVNRTVRTNPTPNPVA
jgi:hypothetical protein